MYRHIDKLIAEQLHEEEPHKLCVAERRKNQLQFKLCGWAGHDLTLGGTTSLTVDGCAATLEGLQPLLYTTGGYGTWIHGDDCHAKILKCESEVREAHTTTGQGGEFREGGSREKEMHYTGSCMLTLVWNSKVAPPIKINITSNYAKFMWDPLAE